ncbi:MAG TPA: DHA2 family efflux MFS transporter permease subunit [Candidatus Acidoferrales bacterium]|jgi:DHA2 family multidrug resistance protein|nr:DHA2 family efflux MFS transporter permease subunit [Candidatus Acidoferrales bacterium]
MTQEWHPRHNPWLIAVGVMLATFMEVLDTSIANIALPHIAGSMSATPDEATWVLTSYLVSNAIILPMTGWLSNYFGRKRLLIMCIGIFTATSALCGAAPTLTTLIIARILQGVGGGAMVPIAQAVLLESFPPQKRGVAMAAFAQGVVVAPILGPTLGGWITDNFSWRWIFYVNLPFGILAAFMAQWLVEDPPYIKRNKHATIDFIGFGLLCVWLATMQVALDKGQEADWLGAVWIRWMLAISIVALIAFIVREFTAEHPLVDMRVFGNRNFAVGVLLMTILAGILYGTTAELPLFMQTLMGYSALQSGLTQSPRGVAAFITTFIVGRIVGKIGNRYLLCFGFCLLAYSAWMLSSINLQVSAASVIFPSVLNGIAISFIFVPLTTTTMGYLAQNQIGNASGFYNLMRNLGGSVGIAFVTTMLARGAQKHQALMVEHMTSTDPAFTQQLAVAQHALARQTDPVTATGQAYSVLYQTLDAQAHLWAFVDNFRLFCLLSLACVPVVFLFKRVSRPPARASAH